MIVTSGGYVKRAAAQNRSMRKKVKILSNDDFSEILHFSLCLYITYDFRTKLTPFCSGPGFAVLVLKIDFTHYPNFDESD